MAEKTKQFKTGVWILLIGICLYALNYLINNNAQSLKNEDFAAVNGTVNSFKKDRSDRSSFYVFTLKEYPNVLFRVDIAYEMIVKNKFETMPIGSLTHLNMLIPKDVYDFKITKTQKRDKRIFNRQSPYIEICALNNPSNSFVYLSLDEYKTHYATRVGGYIRFVGFGFMLSGVFALLKFGFLWLRQYFG